ncbi:hypothetical protein FNV43_RR07896 [Rhamnella rubrinervis]|uniref:Uncharacterized protein n=1 Tax=Rhamnella rubrinervis TaxID=2594499 RepID=A0A8K0HHF0_9ROSA|nr:hypothetical protein FNV43_RR07896 [Rhamnella rubrinervis]
MEGVGARLGRSSTRYGPATVFNGPVRKWKKKWVHVASPSTSSTSSAGAASNANHSHHPQSHTHNGTANGTNGAHLLLYKWTPITQSQNAAINGNHGSINGDKVAGKEDAAAALPDEPPRRKFKYIPIAVLEEQKNEAVEDEAVEKVEDEGKPVDSDLATKGEAMDEKPDINDVPMEESQSLENNQVVRQDLNESTLDLSLGLNAHDGENDPDSKNHHNRDS